MSPKQKTAPKREITPEQTQKIESAISVFQQQWGMNLNARDTQTVIDRVTEHITEQDSEVKIRPPVRNQMFAMLIEKAPEKAISLRIKMHEKRGKTFTDTQKTKIRAVAKTEGWRAGRSALSAAIKRTKGQKKSVEKKPAEAPKPKGGAEVARKSTPKRRVVAPKARKGVAIAPKATQAAEKTGGKTIEQIIKQAEHANNNIIVLWKDYQEKETAIDKKYEKELAGGISSGSLKEQSERVRTRMDSTPEYKKEIQSLEKETLAKLNKQKQKRDVLLKTALKSFGYKDKQLDSVNNQVANAREQMGNYRAVKTPEFQPTDLTQGVRENQFFFSTAMRQLKARAKAKRI